MSVVSMFEIKRIIGLQLGIKTIQDNDQLVEMLGAESLDIANIIAAVEERYQIRIMESEIPKISTALDLFTVVNERYSESGI